MADQTPAHSEFSSALRNAKVRWYNTDIIFVTVNFTSTNLLLESKKIVFQGLNLIKKI